MQIRKEKAETSEYTQAKIFCVKNDTLSMYYFYYLRIKTDSSGCCSRTHCFLSAEEEHLIYKQLSFQNGKVIESVIPLSLDAFFSNRHITRLNSKAHLLRLKRN